MRYAAGHFAHRSSVGRFVALSRNPIHGASPSLPALVNSEEVELANG